MLKGWQLYPAHADGFLDPQTHPLIAQCLWNRGIRNVDESRLFLNPDYSHLHSPFLFAEMERAVTRLKHAIEQQETIAVYADYDADAVTASAVMQRALQYLGATALSYIPDRFTDGYGVHLEGLKVLIDAGARVIVTVDCGINSVEAALFCQEAGVDFIITDHHQVTGELPKAYATINPNIPGDPYPDKSLTGVGVAFKVVSAIFEDEEFLGRRSQVVGKKLARGWEKWLLDLVSIGTVADCQDLRGENRILVSFGLAVLKKTKWPGLSALLGRVGSASPDSQTIGFQLAPKINAAGRLEHASLALGLLLAHDPAEAVQLAMGLEKINEQRKSLTERIYGEALVLAATQDQQPVTVVASPNWHKGVVGIVAGRLLETFAKPAVVLAIDDEGVATGSVRSGRLYNAVKGLAHAKEFLLKYGGHPGAAGLSLKSDLVPNLQRVLWETYDVSLVEGAGENPARLLDAEMNPLWWDLKLLEDLFTMEPFGAGNTTPVFHFSKAVLVSSKLVGTGKDHLQIMLDWHGHKIKGICFRAPGNMRELPPGGVVDVVGQVVMNTWQGRKSPELTIIDMDYNI